MTATNRIALLIATWFGCGYAPAAPGTVGSAAAVAIAVLAGGLSGWRPAYFGLLAVLLIPPGVWAAGVTAKLCGRKDPGIVVVDEVIGQWITLAAAVSLNWKSYLAGFALFRLFDIWKPPPIRRLEALPGGVGIVADDVLAGVYGALVLFLGGCFNLY
jgi:phosphatidylglycerophosphatase A